MLTSSSSELKEDDQQLQGLKAYLHTITTNQAAIAEGLENYKARLDFAAKGIVDIERLDRGHAAGIFSATFQGKKIILKKFIKNGMDEPETVEEAFQTEKTFTAPDSKLSSTRFIKHLFVCKMPSNALCGPANPAIALPYLPRESLDKLKMQEFSWARRIDIAKEIALGLAEMHALNLIYFDLKPGNILIDANFKIKMADLEMVKSETDILEALEKKAKQYKYFEPSFIRGTAAYFAPELSQASPGRIYNTKQSDVFSFGMLLLQMVLGTDIFNRSFNHHIGVVIHENQTKDGCGVSLWRKSILAELKKMKPKTPPDFWNLMNDCLSVNPSDRPTIQQAADRLEKLSKQTNFFPSHSLKQHAFVSACAATGCLLFGPVGGVAGAALGAFTTKPVEILETCRSLLKTFG